MDFSRSNHAQSVRPQQVGPTPTNHSASSPKKGGKLDIFKFTQLVLLIAGTALFAFLLVGIYQGGPTEGKFVNTSDFQAVFLNGGVTNGQVLYSTYFGKITQLNNQFAVLQDVYYITQNASSSSSSSNNIQLTKLGCQQLHAPFDQMIINRNQIAFWENLQSTGQVVQTINKYEAANPHGPNCSQSSGTSQTPASTQSNTGTTANTTTPAANTTGQ